MGPGWQWQESSLVGSSAQALQEQLSSWAGHQHMLPAHGWATPGWRCCQPQGSSGPVGWGARGTDPLGTQLGQEATAAL